MRIAHINILDSIRALSGVHGKIRSQQRASADQGLPITFHVLSYEEPEAPAPGIVYHRLRPGASTWAKQRHKAAAVLEAARGADVVVLRAMARTPPYWAALRRRPFLLLTEHHTKAFEELGLAGSRLKALLERACSRPCMRLSDGLVALTGEILDYELAHGYPWPERGVVIPNGADVRAIAPTGFVPFHGQTLRLCLLASQDLPWHGVDRAVRALTGRVAGARVELHLVGDIPLPAEASRLPAGTVTAHGVKSGPELDALLGTMTLGLSTLALSRKGMREACGLKTREYMARGLPFVYAYDDPDLDAASPGVLRVPDDGQPLDLEALAAFAAACAADPAGLAARMRAHALERMDWRAKMRRYAEFAERIVRLGPARRRG